MSGLLALLLAVLSLASTNPSPASSLVHQEAPGAQVSCSPAVLAAGDYGQTMVPGGQIALAPQICLGDALFLDRQLRYLTEILDPGFPIWNAIGVAVLVTFHEATHSSLETTDETTAECGGMARAMVALGGFGASWYAAQVYDAGLPPAYHSRPC
jgi:hypothetical protein